MSTIGNNANNDTNIFQITKTELRVPVVTLNINDNEKLSDLIRKGFKRSVFWSEYKSKIETHKSDANNLKIILLDSSFQGVNRLFVLCYPNYGNGTVRMNSPRTYAFPRIELTKFNVLIHCRNFYEQPVSDKITKFEELLKVTTGKGEDYTTGCLLDYQYYKITTQ